MPDTKMCPYCGEDVKIEAIKCKYCQSLLSEEDETPKGGRSESLPADVATLYQAVVSFGIAETHLIWVRYTGFLILNGFFVNALLNKWSPPPQQLSLILLVGIIALFVNALWYVLNFAGWHNQNRFYAMAGNLHESLEKWVLPTDDFNNKKDYGCIYLIAQIVPFLLSIGAACCIAHSLPWCYSGLIIWLVVAIIVWCIDHMIISKQKLA